MGWVGEYGEKLAAFISSAKCESSMRLPVRTSALPARMILTSLFLPCSGLAEALI